mgnify:CR=1 FL=1
MTEGTTKSRQHTDADARRARRRRLLLRSAPLAALLAGGLTLIVSSLGPSAAEEAAERFARAWERSDYAAMHAELGGEISRLRDLAEINDHVRPEAPAQPPEGRLRDPGHWSQIQRHYGRNLERKGGHALNLQRGVNVSNVDV